MLVAKFYLKNVEVIFVLCEEHNLYGGRTVTYVASVW